MLRLMIILGLVFFSGCTTEVEEKENEAEEHFGPQPGGDFCEPSIDL